MNLWNRKDLEPPATTTYKASSFKGIADLKYHFKEALQCFDNLDLLEKESALLSRCIYRMKTKFRSDKGFKSMEKVNRCLLQFNRLKFSNNLENFYDLLPENATDDRYLPSRNMLDYILVRLQGVTQLMYRVVETAKITALHMGNRVSIGHFWKVALIMLGIAARIWMLSKDLVKVCCNFYKNILPTRNNLRNIGSNWLPEDYSFPGSLEEWIGFDLVDFNNAPVTVDLLKRNVPVLDIVDGNSDVEEMGEYVNIIDSDSITDTDVNIVEASEQASMFDLLMKNEDLGEIVVGEAQLQKNKNKIDDSDEDAMKDEKITKKQKKRKKSNKVKGITATDNEDIVETWKQASNFDLLTKNEDLGEVVGDEQLQKKRIRIDNSDEDVIKDEQISKKQKKKRKKSNKVTVKGITATDDLNIVETCQQRSTFDLLMKNKDLGGAVVDEQLQKNQIKTNDSDEDIIIDEKITKKRKKKSKNKNNNVTIKQNFQDNKTLINNNKLLNETKCIKTKISNKNESKIGEFPIGKEKLQGSHGFTRVDNLNSVKKLKKFMIKEHRKKENNDSSSLFIKLNKLQWNTVHKDIKIFMKKVANGKIADQECLRRAKEIIKKNM